MTGDTQDQRPYPSASLTPEEERVCRAVGMRVEQAEAVRQIIGARATHDQRLTDAEADDYSNLISRLRRASEVARRAERHWPADCMTEAAHAIVFLAARCPGEGPTDADDRECPCGCPPSAHIGEIGCPCGLPDEHPCSPNEGPADNGLREHAPTEGPTRQAADNLTPLDQARADLIKAQLRLTLRVEAACSGSHRTVQHRDGLSPWCPHCRRFADGKPIRADRLAATPEDGA